MSAFAVKADSPLSRSLLGIKRTCVAALHESALTQSGRLHSGHIILRRTISRTERAPFGKVIRKKGVALWGRRNAATGVLRPCALVKCEMKRRAHSLKYTSNCANDRIALTIGIIVTICGGVVLFTTGSTGAMAESGIASVYAYSGTKTASGERANCQSRGP